MTGSWLGDDGYYGDRSIELVAGWAIVLLVTGHLSVVAAREVARIGAPRKEPNRKIGFGVLVSEYPRLARVFGTQTATRS